MTDPTFESLHPRGNPGKPTEFTDKLQSAPPASTELPVPSRPATAGDRILIDGRVGHVMSDDGLLEILYPNGDVAIEPANAGALVVETAEEAAETAATRAGIESIYETVIHLDADQSQGIRWTFEKINVGGWGELNKQAGDALMDADIDLGLMETSDELYNDLHRGAGEDDTQIIDAALASTTARALAARTLIGQVDGWTQEAYDHVTRPWRQNIGQVHPSDELEPASWSKRAIPSAAEKRAFDRDLARLDQLVVDKGAYLVEMDEDTGDIYEGIDEEKFGPELSAEYSALQARGYERGLFTFVHDEN